MKNIIQWYITLPLSFTPVNINKFPIDSQVEFGSKLNLNISRLKKNEIEQLVLFHDTSNLHWFSFDEVLDRLKSNHLCYVARVNNDIVGFSWIGVDNVYSKDLRCNFFLNDQGVITYNSYVNPDFRGMNVLPAIKNTAFGEARQNGKKWGFNYVHSRNKSIIKSSQKFGSKKVGGLIYGYFLGVYFLFHSIQPHHELTISMAENPFHIWKSLLTKLKIYRSDNIE